MVNCVVLRTKCIRARLNIAGRNVHLAADRYALSRVDLAVSKLWDKRNSAVTYWAGHIHIRYALRGLDVEQIASSEIASRIPEHYSTPIGSSLISANPDAA